MNVNVPDRLTGVVPDVDSHVVAARILGLVQARFCPTQEIEDRRDFRASQLPERCDVSPRDDEGVAWGNRECVCNRESKLIAFKDALRGHLTERAIRVA